MFAISAKFHAFNLSLSALDVDTGPCLSNLFLPGPIVFRFVFIGFGNASFSFFLFFLAMDDAKMAQVTDTQAAVAANTGAEDVGLADAGDMELLGRWDTEEKEWVDGR